MGLTCVNAGSIDPCTNEGACVCVTIIQ
jgi:hypothetical protein